MSDLISRQAALDCFHAWIDRYGDVHTPDEMPEYRAIEAVPSAEPERNKGRQRWIPCSERLPVARRSVVLSTKDWTGEGCYWETTEHHVIWKGYRWNATFWDDEVIAWMPLPEPYKGEQT